MISNSLPRASELQAVLRRINDDFMHTNSKYYHRHTEAQSAGPDSISLLVHYFDRHSEEHRGHVLAFLHLMVVLQDSLARAWQDLFPKARSINPGLSVFEKTFTPRLEELLGQAPYTRSVVVELGLWKLAKAG